MIGFVQREPVRVAPQLGIPHDLFRRQHLDGGEMIFQVRRSKGALHRGHVPHAIDQARLGDGLAGELPV
jgi:hypothetical protein